MALFTSRNTSKKESDQPRWFAGINISSDCRRIEASMIGVHGQGSGAPIEIRKAMSFDLPREITNSFNELQELASEGFREHERDTSSRWDGFVNQSLYFHVARELASVEEEALEELVCESRIVSGDVLAVGINDPGVRRPIKGGVFYQSLCDAPFLAEQTGLNIVDSFPSQDVALRGRGGPILSMPAWVFLKSESRDRILLDLGRTARFTFLPQPVNSFAHQRIECRDIVPCGSLLDALTWELTQGKSAVDVGGKLTVQGCQIPVLMSEFRSLMKNQATWNLFGLSPTHFFSTAVSKAMGGHSYQDVLCTASCFIAETISETLLTTIEGTGSEPEILLTGSARQHGMLMNLITSGLQKRSLTSITQYGFPSETFDSLCVAILTLMCVDRIPSNLPHLTGCDASKPLGRITPGSVANWQRLLQAMVQTKPAVRTLRSAM